ncbi:aminotransferase class V-fold PLP-dependent enzyme [Olivibacter sitiensis]|uniref:aminotransferase class V-fold PLP-dependent enzyme n=1 Tax=Olivibacter sitiensis TaxID=376470 RepID=UPI00040475ED|nr:aminotransferase class V-fold PLP-dependent enzyme [Olivibacter sitiensis]
MRRRELLKYLSVVPVGGAMSQYVDFGNEDHRVLSKAPRNLFEELGVRTFINAAGTYTAMTGSLMREETLEAINYSAQDFCMLDDLQDKVGERIAKMVHAESAVITSGCFSALTLGLAGILTGNDPDKVSLLPHIDGTDIKSEVICQKGHNIGYGRALKNTGCKIVLVETAEEAKNAINERTAMMFFVHIMSDQGQIQHQEWLDIAKKYDIPTMIDMAADVPPVSNLWRFNDMGFDLVCVSGGKAMRGPQSAGILMGKKALIDATRLNMFPRGDTIGRGMKVNKEEILGMYVALEKFMNLDHEKEWKAQEASVNHIIKAVKSVSDNIFTEIVVPPLGNVTPTLHMNWDADKIKINGKELQRRLREGNPSIEIASSEDNKLVLTVWMLKPGQEKIVAVRLKEEMLKMV